MTELSPAAAAVHVFFFFCPPCARAIPSPDYPHIYTPPPRLTCRCCDWPFVLRRRGRGLFLHAGRQEMIHEARLSASAPDMSWRFLHLNSRLPCPPPFFCFCFGWWGSEGWRGFKELATNLCHLEEVERNKLRNQGFDQITLSKSFVPISFDKSSFVGALAASGVSRQQASRASEILLACSLMGTLQ